jgi:glycosyltransferase involved in cell wall biosynthesis
VSERRAPGPLVLTSSPGGALVAPDPARSPRIDYLEIARAVGGEVLHPAAAGGLAGALETRARRFGDWRQAWRARRSGAPAYLSLSEGAAMGLVALDRRRPHVAVVHHLTSARRRALQRRTGWLGRLDRIVVFSERQRAYLVEEAGYPEEHVRYVPFSVDERFFATERPPGPALVASAGQHRRDYATLAEAVGRLGVPTEIAASSPWMTGGGVAGPVPPNVTVHRALDRPALRDLYDRATAIVVPLEAGQELSAGVTAVLEAMAMARPLVATAAPGIAEYVRGDGVVTVPAGDPAALAEALDGLLRDPARARELGAAGRARVEARHTLDAYVAGLSATLAEVADVGPGAPRA